MHILKAGFYGSYLKELIIRYKFSPCRELSAYLAALIVPLVKSQVQISQKLWIVYVPCSSQGLRLRGWDQMEEITNKLLDIPYVIKAPILQRSDGKQQKIKTRAQRLGEVAGVFSLRAQLSSTQLEKLPTPDRIVVIDDVYTTGATMHECIKILKLHFTCSVSGICLAMD